MQEADYHDDPSDDETEDGGSLHSEEEDEEEEEVAVEEEEEEEAASDGSWASEEDLPLPGGAVPMAPGGPAAQPQPYRQLKVEDALAYLDQVKSKFEKQPQIYNKVCACVHARCLDRWRVRRTPEPRRARRHCDGHSLARVTHAHTPANSRNLACARASRGSSSTS